MNLVFVISKGYLHAFQEEASNYSFSINGYTTLQEAHNNLFKRNLADHLGFIYMANELPKNINALSFFMKRVDFSAPKGMLFILALKTTRDLALLKHKLHLTNLDVQLYTNWNDVTDLVIGDLFAPLLQNNFTLYQGLTFDDVNKQDKAKIISPFGKFKSLKYEQLFAPNVLDIIAPYNNLGSLEKTLQSDVTLFKLQEKDRLSCELRRQYLRAEFEPITQPDALFSKLKKVTKNDVVAQALLNKFNIKKGGRV